ncbi:glucokinase regulatory protein-like isoform X2 [Gigantopelta aegis]|nr:glucokinase regulatory protein-like isoform X2 [Gigantopelta aegis]
MMSSPHCPITELRNSNTTNIEVCSPIDIVSLLQKCDAEIFDGWDDYPGIFSERIQNTLNRIVSVAATILENPEEGAIVFSGCGTSGRLAFITTKTFNGRLKKEGKTPCYQYIIAGGDKALFTSQEAIEDDPVEGEKILEQTTAGKSRVLYIGITCGLSAPFVAGQLDHCMKNTAKFTPVLLGFNSVDQARNLPIEKWDQTFLQVVKKLEHTEKEGKGFILNPIIGPEPITGSSRMKSGSATKILLESIFVTAHTKVFCGQFVRIPDFIKSYKMVCDSTYKEKVDIAALIEMAGRSLNAGCCIYYLGLDNLAIMGMIDASECPPTFGATLDDVRGFIREGYAEFPINEGNISHLGKHFRISKSDFDKDILPTLSKDDLIVVLTSDTDIVVDHTTKETKCQKALVFIGDETEKMPTEVQSLFDKTVNVTLPMSEMSRTLPEQVTRGNKQLYAEMSVKWILNSISTGAHILKGKIYQNIMVDVKVSNNKLFHRAVGIIQRYSDLSTAECKEYLLRSIYHTDNLKDDQVAAPIAEHIAMATPQQKIVPVALVAAILKCPVDKAKSVLEEHHVITTAISSTLEKVSSDAL